VSSINSKINTFNFNDILSASDSECITIMHHINIRKKSFRNSHSNFIDHIYFSIRSAKKFNNRYNSFLLDIESVASDIFIRQKITINPYSFNVTNLKTMKQGLLIFDY